MDIELMINSFPKLLSATLITLKLLSVSLILGLFIGLGFAILRMNNNKFINKDIYESYKNKYIETEELPLPNINNLRKWIKNEKKAS